MKSPTSTESPCSFDRSTFTFVGTPLEQAKCLLRRVQIRGHLDAPLERLPEPLEDRIGKPVTITAADLRRYLSAHGIAPADIGGELDRPLSPADSTAPRGGGARYFVIHDTSTPNYVADFPENINKESWSGNNLNRVDPNITHVYVNRLGQSRTVVNFGRALPGRNAGTKFACCLGERRKGLFIHIELIQPRHCDSSNGRCGPYRPGSNIANRSSNDNIAPNPGFTMDAKIQNAHDDPQNFDLAEWVRSLATLIAEIQSR